MSRVKRWTRRRVMSAFLMVGLSLSLAACTGSGSGHPSVEEAFGDLEAKPVSAVVAEVDGRRIGAEELVARRGDALSNDEALEALIVRELLVAQAKERGHHTRETLQLARKQAMVQRLLAQEVEAPVEREELDPEALKKSVEQLRRRVGHPPGLQASHLLVSVPPEAQKDASKEEIKKWFDASREWLGVIGDDLSLMPSIPDLYEVRDRYRDALPEPLEIHVNAHLIFPIDAFLKQKEGEPKSPSYGQDMPDTWRPVVAEFGQAATDLARAGKFHELSDPVRSNFGWHLLMAEKLYPAEVADEAQLREVAAAELVRQARHKELVARMTEWMDEASVQTFPQVIAEAHDTQN